jgi:ABC-type multidrug transport system fused ATPase/permease subunit
MKKDPVEEKMFE